MTTKTKSQSHGAPQSVKSSGSGRTVFRRSTQAPSGESSGPAANSPKQANTNRGVPSKPVIMVKKNRPSHQQTSLIEEAPMPPVAEEMQTGAIAAPETEETTAVEQTAGPVETHQTASVDEVQVTPPQPVATPEPERQNPVEATAETPKATDKPKPASESPRAKKTQAAAPVQPPKAAESPLPAPATKEKPSQETPVAATPSAPQASGMSVAAINEALFMMPTSEVEKVFIHAQSIIEDRKLATRRKAVEEMMAIASRAGIDVDLETLINPRTGGMLAESAPVRHPAAAAPAAAAATTTAPAPRAPRVPRPVGPKSERTKPPIKFANPENPAEVWTGRGKLPRWLQRFESVGRSKEEFRINNG